MSQTKQQIQALLAAAATSPRHRFGQNFMVDRNLVTLIAEAGQLTQADTVLEIGPGTGTLTEELLARAGQVIAVEIDRDLAGLLRSHFADRSNFTLLEGDALAGKHALNSELSATIARLRSDHRPVKLVANLPYNIASPLIIELLLAGVTRLAFTVQKEVALRLVADAGSDDYGPLTVMAQSLASVHLLRTLPPQAFWPAPKIDSALVAMDANSRLLSLGATASGFSRFVHQLFAARRKMLRKALDQAGFDLQPADAEALALTPTQRPETLTVEQFIRLFQTLNANLRRATA